MVRTPDPEGALVRLEATVNLLATGAGEITGRLAEAYEMMATLVEIDFPEEMRDHFVSITRVMRRGESVDATPSDMDRDAGVEVAREIVRLRDALRAFLSVHNITGARLVEDMSPKRQA